MSANPLTHLDSEGTPRMVNVSEKCVSKRTASAEAYVDIGSDLCAIIQKKGEIAKGNVIDTAKIAGIQAAKRTSDLIPLCHPLPIDSVDINTEINESHIRLISTVECEAKTGVEMEAMTAVSVAALTIYDMVKSAGKSVEIGPIRLLEKTGGQSGHWRRSDA